MWTVDSKRLGLKSKTTSRKWISCGKASRRFSLACALPLRESTDDTLRNEDIGQLIRFSVLARIPVLRSPHEQVRQKWYRAAEVASVTLLILLSVAVGLYTCLPTTHI